MRVYNKPIIMTNDEMNEGVYAASGASVSEPKAYFESGDGGNLLIKFPEDYKKCDNGQWRADVKFTIVVVDSLGEKDTYSGVVEVHYPGYYYNVQTGKWFNAGCRIESQHYDESI